MKPAHLLPSLGRCIPILLLTVPLHAQLAVPTHRYDAARTGANLAESQLTVSTVNVTRFGKLHSYPVHGSVYAQPLYVPGVTVGGATRNMLYVATMNDKVYAFDADSTSSSPLWARDFTNPPSVTPVPITDIVAPDKNIVGNVGIQSTPVIDVASGTIYLVARTKESGAYVQRLHALDIATGASRPGSPVTIQGSVPGAAPDGTAGATGTVVTFNPKMQSQRTALALSNGVVLIAWAGHEDALPYHGWIMGYDAATLAQAGIFCVSPDGYAGGIWQAGRAPTIDAAGNAYFATGNGDWNGTRNFGNSLLKVSVSRSGLSLIDYFTPSNYQQLNTQDDDLSGSGFTLLPGNRLLGGGKEGVLYMLDAANLGRIVTGDTQVPQRFQTHGGHVMGGPVYWNSASLGPLVYNWSEDDVLKMYRYGGGALVLPPYAQGNVVSPGHPGGSLTVSANGGASGSGIVWASMPTNQDGIHGLVGGVVRAFDAETLREIWNSEQHASRDRVGTLMKFVPPLVVNGRVYVPSHDGQVSVYGLLPSAPAGSPGTISVDFVGSNPAAMAASESAGVIPTSHWNAAFGGASSGPLALMDSTGAATPATLTWAAPSGTWALPIADAPGNARMMRGYLDTGTTSRTTVSVGGLPASTYDVYVYVDGDNRSYDRGAAYTISGAGISPTTVNLTDAANTNFSGTFVQASGGTGNYVRFTVATSAFTIEAVTTTPVDGNRRAPINGMQIVPAASTPPPDFTLHESPHARTVTQGSATSFTVTVGALNGFTGTVALSASDLPPNATASFNPASISGSGSSTLTIATTSGTPVGASEVIVTGRSGSLTRSTHVELTVEPTPTTTTSRIISVDFVGSHTLTMAPSEAGGVIAKGNWNTAFGALSSQPLPLVDETGVSTPATVAWSAPGGTWVLPVGDDAGSMRMMKGYLDTSSTTSTTVSVAGLPQGTYDVYIYADGDNKSYDRSATYVVRAGGITTSRSLTDSASSNFAGLFRLADNSAGNYLVFRITGTEFTLEATPGAASTTTRRAPVNGLQIVPVPEGPPPPPVRAIGVDFTGSGTAMAASETAGVTAQSNWNHAAGAVRSSPLGLVDAAGAATNAAVTWSANGLWSLPIADQPGNFRMMRGYLDTNSSSITTISVTGLTSGNYYVYVYVDGDNRSYVRTANYRLSAPGNPDSSLGVLDNANTNFDGTFRQASPGNYVRFVLTGATGFTLTATPVSGETATLRAPVNAIQIVPR